MTSDTDLQVVIIGAGIVGVTLAHALLERSIPVQIYEASSTIRTTGGGINATEAGVRALKLCGKPCYEAFAEVGTFHHRGRPDLFWSVTQGDKVAEVISKNEYGSMPRIKFLEALASRLPAGAVRFNSRLKSLRTVAGRIELCFECGTVETADVVLGCDGLHSRMKQYVVRGGYDVSFSHSVIARAPVPAKDVEAIVGKALGRGAQVGIGHGDGFVLYPVDETTVNMGYYYYDPRPWQHWPHVIHRSTKTDLLEFMQSKQVDPKHLALAKLFPDEVPLWGIMHQERDLPTYSQGGIAILGDAAHPMEPFLSTGAGQGYEDAVVCAELLHAVVRKRLSGPERKEAMEAALKVYSDTRIGRSQYIVHSSTEAGRVLKGARTSFEDGAKEYADRNYEVWNHNIRASTDSALQRLSEII